MKALLKQIALDEGASDVGIAPADSLTDKPSMYPNYLLPRAKSIISFIVPLDGVVIRRYLGKESSVQGQ